MIVSPHDGLAANATPGIALVRPSARVTPSTKRRYGGFIHPSEGGHLHVAAARLILARLEPLRHIKSSRCGRGVGLRRPTRAPDRARLGHSARPTLVPSHRT